MTMVNTKLILALVIAYLASTGKSEPECRKVLDCPKGYICVHKDGE